MNLFPRSRQIAFLSDYVPRRCGIATFTHHLCEAISLEAEDSKCVVIAVNDRAGGYDFPPEVRFEIQQEDLDDYRTAADQLNQNKADVLCVQHEFGIYGGPAGNHLLALLREVRMPVVTTLHTVLIEPNEAQRRVMDELIRQSDRLVVMAQKGAAILREVYGVPDAMIDVIPHGIPDLPYLSAEAFKAQFDVAGRSVLLTFGLLGPGKGIEQGIRAMPAIIQRHPQAVYLILGATHPHLLAREGEKYRTRLEHLAEDLGVGDHVIFYNRFVSEEDLIQFIGATDIYITPYPNEEQITSGTLAYVSGAGRVVVSTPYWHAQELLSEGAGVIVPFQNPAAISDAVIGLLDDPERMERMRQKVYANGRTSIWSAVAQRYLETFERAKSDRRTVPVAVLSKSAHATRMGKLPALRLRHVMRMTDDTGIFQHATYNVPNYREGYCTDDNARAFILSVLLEETALPSQKEQLGMMATRYLAFLVEAFDQGSGRFRNFMSLQRQWLEAYGSEDSHGRALWALGTGAGHTRDVGHRSLAAETFERGLPAVLHFTSPRAWAFSLLGINHYRKYKPVCEGTLAIEEDLVERILSAWRHASEPDWLWFETKMSYDNARLSQALILSGKATGNSEALNAGMESLRWLSKIQKSEAGHFRPIGSNGFHEKNGKRADFDQQPVEAQAMVAASLDAFKISGDAFWWREARRAFEWFLGRNDLGIPLHDAATGGCRDGLHHHRANENQGAESTLAYQIALAEMTAAEHFIVHPSIIQS